MTNRVKGSKQKQDGSRYSVNTDKSSHSTYTSEILARYLISSTELMIIFQ